MKNTEGEDSFDLNSPLSSINRKNPFGVDASYFEDFGKKLNDSISDLEEIKKEAPFLASIPRYNPFEVPADYFDAFPNQLQELITISPTRFSIKDWLLQFIRPNFVFPVLTTIFIAIVAIQMVNKQVEHPQTEMTADLSLEEQLYPIDESTLVELLNENTTETESLTSSSDEVITNYLLDNNVDEAVLNTDNTVDHENK